MHALLNVIEPSSYLGVEGEGERGGEGSWWAFLGTSNSEPYNNNP